MKVKTLEDWALERDQLLDDLNEFAEVMNRRPFQNEAGLRGVSAFALYWNVKRLQPNFVLEVGVWRGFSTWIIQQAAPDAEIWGFDPVFFFDSRPRPVYHSERVRYLREDFSCVDLEGVIKDPDKTLAFFDDHHRQIARIEQSRRFGIQHILVDDNPPFPYSNRTLEDERRDPSRAAMLEEMLELYEVFPAVWAVDDAHEFHVKEPGLGFPVTDHLRYLYDERKWHSYVTYVKARALEPSERGTAVRSVALQVPTPSVGGTPAAIDINVRVSLV